jgi:hypothetical protein
MSVDNEAEWVGGKNSAVFLQTLSDFHKQKSSWQQWLFFSFHAGKFPFHSFSLPPSLFRSFEKCSLDLLQFRNKIHKQNV